MHPGAVAFVRQPQAFPPIDLFSPQLPKTGNQQKKKGLNYQRTKLHESLSTFAIEGHACDSAPSRSKHLQSTNTKNTLSGPFSISLPPQLPSPPVSAFPRFSTLNSAPPRCVFFLIDLGGLSVCGIVFTQAPPPSRVAYAWDQLFRFFSASISLLNFVFFSF